MAQPNPLETKQKFGATEVSIAVCDGKTAKEMVFEQAVRSRVASQFRKPPQSDYQRAYLWDEIYCNILVASIWLEIRPGRQLQREMAPESIIFGDGLELQRPREL
jgi:hypothetical protein